MGEVYQAKDTKLGRNVAIKVLPQAIARDPDRVSRFEREAKLFAAADARSDLFSLGSVALFWHFVRWRCTDRRR
jgi:serine/threonine protein kinase